MRLAYIRTQIICDDGNTYNVDPVVSIIVSMMLHVCARDCLNAENVYNRVMSWLVTPGFFSSQNSEWGDVAFMSLDLAKCIDNDAVLRKALPRIAENWKQKLRIKSPAIIQSLKSLRKDFVFPNQDTSIILREVTIIL